VAATKARTASSQSEYLVVFQVADQSYGLPLHVVREILPLAMLSQPPGLPPVLAGFLNLGGVAVPVVRLARLFGLAEQPPGLYTPLIHVHCDDAPLALLVDAVHGITPINESAIVPLHQDLCFNNCAVGLTAVGQLNLILLSAERLLCEEERRRVRELAAIEQARLGGFVESAS
jgi:purine-binding chemotaxis protein CheW